MQVFKAVVVDEKCKFFRTVFEDEQLMFFRTVVEVTVLLRNTVNDLIVNHLTTKDLVEVLFHA